MRLGRPVVLDRPWRPPALHRDDLVAMQALLHFLAPGAGEDGGVAVGRRREGGEGGRVTKDGRVAIRRRVERRGRSGGGRGRSEGGGRRRDGRALLRRRLVGR
eukprot:557711-Hanusia_phi.AAC.1